MTQAHRPPPLLSLVVRQQKGAPMFDRIRRVIASAAPTARVVENDPVLGRLVPSADAAWWEVRVPVGLNVVGFKIGGEVDPSPELIAHSRDVVRAFPEFSRRVAAFLEGEAARFGPLANEVRQLEVEYLCLFWPARPDDGMIYFRGPDEYRVWRCDYLGREPVSLGFDS